ncbi:unnamed protein product [marine sediment metagenome]|uniref:Uncharacterized protein n=1 Tax=marine sediment metagenome TaxID=412755 RepID=X1CN01_9ZZZZ
MIDIDFGGGEAALFVLIGIGTRKYVNVRDATFNFIAGDAQ